MYNSIYIEYVHTYIKEEAIYKRRGVIFCTCSKGHVKSIRIRYTTHRILLFLEIGQLFSYVIIIWRCMVVLFSTCIASGSPSVRRIQEKSMNILQIIYIANQTLTHLNIQCRFCVKYKITLLNQSFFNSLFKK